MPDELKNLTWIEELLIARAHVVGRSRPAPSTQSRVGSGLQMNRAGILILGQN